MATSGSTDFNMTRNEIIQDTLLLLGVLGAEETVNSADQDIAGRALNRMIKSWQAQGINLWRLQESTLFFVDEQGSYVLSSGASGADMADTVVTTTTGADEASLQTVITLTSSAGMTAADWIGIELDDGSLHETTIVSVDDSTTVTITTGIASAATSGNEVYTYTTKAARPLRIENIRYRISDDTDTTLNEVSREEYFELPTKDTAVGRPVSWYYDPGLNDTIGGQLYFWPKPNDVSARAKLTYVRSVEDFDAAGNNPDFPQEWLDAIVYGLALRLAPMYGKDDKLPSIGVIADTLLQQAKEFDIEPTDINIVPDRRS